MATVSIGGTPYEITALTFAALKRAWPHLQKNQELSKKAARAAETGEEADEPDPIESMANAIAILSCGLVRNHPELTAEGIEERITARECQELDSVIIELMIESGFMQRGAAPEGEAVPAGANASDETASAETSTESSPSSSATE